jgi:pimeloyl-ACP methyl ester carboxylesterase
MADVVVDGVRLVYEVQGDGPPVLLIAGTGMPAAMWSVLATPHLLGAGYSVVAFDNRGIAPSDIPPPPYTVEEMAGDAIGLLEHLDLGPVAVLGASLGGTIAQNVALRRPDLVGAAIFMVGVGRVSALGAATIRALIELLELPGDPPPAILAALMAPTLLAPPVWGDDDAVAAGLAMGAMFLPPDQSGLLGQYHANLSWAETDHLDELAALDVPALAIAAEFCTIFPPASVKAAVARMPHGRYVEIPGAPHVALAPESQDLISTAYVDFLAEAHPAHRARTAAPD